MKRNIMSLIVEISSARPHEDDSNLYTDRPSWGVSIDDDGDIWTVMNGFASRADAERAMRGLSECGVDWSLPPMAVRDQFLGMFGSPYEVRKNIKRIACEQLRW